MMVRYSHGATLPSASCQKTCRKRMVYSMSDRRTATAIFNEEFLEIRAKLLEVGAALDRIDRAEGSLSGDPRLHGIRRAIDVLAAGRGDRATEIQMIFSRGYDGSWRQELQIGDGE